MIDKSGLILILVVLALLWLKSIDSNNPSNVNTYEKIKLYIVNNNESQLDNKKAIIWVWIPYHYNSRKWSSFYSRSSTDLNLPFINLTIESIIKHNPNYHICLIDDMSFNTLIENWTIDLEQIPDPIKENVRYLAQLKILEIYGGIMMPSYFLCCKNIDPLFNQCYIKQKPFIINNLNHSINITHDTIPNKLFIGCLKNDNAIKELIHNQQIIISKNQSGDLLFKETINHYCLNMINQKKITPIDGKIIGVLDKNNHPILIDDWFNEKWIPLDNNFIGILLPYKDIINRTNYNWFCKLNEKQIINGNYLLAKYFVLANKNVHY